MGEGGGEIRVGGLGLGLGLGLMLGLGLRLALAFGVRADAANCIVDDAVVAAAHARPAYCLSSHLERGYVRLRGALIGVVLSQPKSMNVFLTGSFWRHATLLAFCAPPHIAMAARVREPGPPGNG